jgi:inner membrane protein
MTIQESIKKTGDVIRNSATFKIFSISILVLVLLIPASMISSLMRERESRHNTVVREINSKWGWSQTITGPFFTIPFKEYYKDQNKELKFNIKYFHILPQRLDIFGKINPHIRYRSLYEAVLYNTKLTLVGNFILPSPEQINLAPDAILWEKALFSIGISDMRGIQENIKITFNGDSYAVNPGLKTTDIASAGVSAGIPLAQNTVDSGSFSFQLNLNGSEQIKFIPMGEETNVAVKSDWPSPSFNGGLFA